MTLYDINQDILSCMTIDPETGETEIDEERYAALEVARTDKLENIACWVKNLRAEEKALAEEIKALTARKSRTECLSDRITGILERELDGAPMNTAKVAVSYRKSSMVVIDNAGELIDRFLRIKPEPDKTAIKNAIAAGEKVLGAHLEEKNNIQIK